VKEYAQGLKEYRTLVGEPVISARLTEKDAKLTLSHDLKKEDLGKIDSARLVSVLKIFGTTLKCYASQVVGSQQLGAQELNPETLEAGLFTGFMNDLSAGADCRLEVEIDKTKLINKAFGPDHGRLLMYFDSQRAHQILDQDLVSLEKEWFSQNEKLFIVLGEPYCILRGEILNIFGDVPEKIIREAVTEPLPDKNKDSLSTRLSTRARETHWQNGTKFLLSEYLRVHDEGDQKDQAFTPKLNKHFLDLTIASLANFTHTEESTLVSLFEGQKRFEVKADAAVPVPDEVCNTWFEIYDWTYDDRTADKLAIVRNLITLQTASALTQNYAVMISHADQLLRSAKDHYERFVGESIKQYFDKLKDATTYVQSKVDAIGQQVGNLIDTFIKNLLATAGFLIGTVLWKIADLKLVAAYPVIIFAFLAYMVVILVVYYPIMWWSYHLTSKEYDHSLELYNRSFTEADVDTFIGKSFDKRKIQFWVAFIVTVLIHVWLLIMALVAHRYRWLR
jgi:hypothetical protein